MNSWLIILITASCAMRLTRPASLNTVYPDQALPEPAPRASLGTSAKRTVFKAYNSLHNSSIVRYFNKRSAAGLSDAGWNKAIKIEKEYDQPPIKPWAEADEDQSLEEYVGNVAGTYERLQPLLTWFFVRIREFIWINRRDRIVFDTEAEEFRKELRAIEILVRLSPFSATLAYQLSYAKHIYSFAVDARKLLYFFTLTKDEGELVIIMILLNTWILSLHDDYGIPNPDAPNYAHCLITSTRVFDYCKKRFSMLGHYPLSFKLLLERQLIGTERTLNFSKGLIKKGTSVSETSGNFSMIYVGNVMQYYQSNEGLIS